METQQPHGYASLIAAQAGVPLDLPLIACPGVPNLLTLNSLTPLPELQLLGGLSTGRIDPALQPMNLAVPGAKVRDALVTRPDGLPSLTSLVLGSRTGVARSQVEWAKNLHPTTILLWIGSNDVLAGMTDSGVTHADPSYATPIPQFYFWLTRVMARLSNTGAKLVVANIPDVTLVPFLTPALQVAAQFGLPPYLLRPALGLGPADFVTPEALPIIASQLAHGIQAPLPPEYVLTASEALTLKAYVLSYNVLIAFEAKRRGATLVDVYSLVNNLARNGVTIDGKHLTTGYLGGLFSLDGVHPTDTGYALIANHFIKTMNDRMNAGIPLVPLGPIASSDPLAPPVIAPLVPSCGN